MDQLERRELSSDISTGVNALSQTTATDLIVVLFLVLLAGAVIVKEHENGLFYLIRPNYQSGAVLAGAKLLVMLASAFGVALVFYGSNMLFIFWSYGFGDWMRPIQSVQGFLGSSFQITVLQYVLLFLFGKIAACCLIGIFLLAVGALFKNNTLLILTAVVSVLLYQYIDPYSIFKYLNLNAFLQPQTVVEKYLNLNLFEYPFSVTLVLLVEGILFLLLQSALQSNEFAILRNRNAFQLLEQQYQFMKEYQERTGTDLSFVPDRDIVCFSHWQGKSKTAFLLLNCCWCALFVFPLFLPGNIPLECPGFCAPPQREEPEVLPANWESAFFCCFRCILEPICHSL